MVYSSRSSMFISYYPHHHIIRPILEEEKLTFLPTVPMMIDVVPAFPLPSCSVRIWYESVSLGYPTSKDSFLKKVTPRECRERGLTYGLMMPNVEPNLNPITNPNPTYDLISTHNNDVSSAIMTATFILINIGTVLHFKLQYVYLSMKQNQFSFIAGWEIVQ